MLGPKKFGIDLETTVLDSGVKQFKKPDTLEPCAPHNGSNEII